MIPSICCDCPVSTSLCWFIFPYRLCSGSMALQLQLQCIRPRMPKGITIARSDRAAAIAGRLHATNPGFLATRPSDPAGILRGVFFCEDSPRSGPTWAGKFRVTRFFYFCAYLECRPTTSKHHIWRTKSHFRPKILGLS